MTPPLANFQQTRGDPRGLVSQTGGRIKLCLAHQCTEHPPGRARLVVKRPRIVLVRTIIMQLLHLVGLNYA
jgi:hypothetical protein